MVTVPEVDDMQLMQESKGNFMANEAREKIEAPQNYGFTSVVRDAVKGADGKIQQSAETFVQFMGGNRSFPVFGNMDDRRFRLKELQKGDTAMFDYLQHQLHMNADGIFVTGRTDKKLKIQLVDPPQQSGGSPSAQTTDASGGGGSGSQSSMGQTQRYKNSTKQYVEVTKDSTNLVHDQTIQHKTGVHSFQPPESGGTSRAGGSLVQIFGDKFTGGLGYFMKQVTAAPPTSSMHLTTQGYVQSIINGLGFNMPSIPNLPMPPLPPGITLPPGVTLPQEAEPPQRPIAATTWVGELLHRLDAIETRLTTIEQALATR
jgi:phage gp45-like